MTSERGRTAALPLAGIFALVAAVAGCTAFDVFRAAPDAGPAAVVAVSPPKAEEPARIPFDHQFHLGRGPACEDCHAETEKNVKAPMPDPEFCKTCHEEIDAKKPKEKTLAAFMDKDGKTPAWSHVTAQSPDISFSHKTHLEKKVACAECHKGIEESKAVTKELFVDMDACVKCHEAKKAKTECATCHQASAKSVADGKGPYWPPANHDAAWRGAHGAVARSDAPKARAEECGTCHGKEGFPVAKNCDVCHAATKPANHEKLWTAMHGQAVRRDPSVRGTKCAFCHDADAFPAEKKCTGCHMTEPPRDHSQSWRVGGGHGLAASMDRDRCAACHTADTCSTCHATVAPRSHRGGWGAPRARHCTGCHLPLEKDAPGGCGVCHEGTPSHQAAPPMPASPPHSPDLTCRKCHFRLRHADNGTNCVTCHR